MPDKICTLHSSVECKDRTYDRECGLNQHATCPFMVIATPPEKGEE